MPVFRSLATIRRQYRKQKRARVAGKRKYAMKSNAPLVKLIRQAVQREQETKYVANSYQSDATTALGNTWYSLGSLAAQQSWFPAMPKLNEGTGDYQRVGSKIHVKKMSVSMKIGFDPQNIDANSLYGVIYYGTSKANRSWMLQNPIDNQQILDGGDGINYTWNGDRFRLNYPVDKKLYNIKRIVFRLTKTEGIQNSDLSGAAVVGGNYSTANGLQCRNFTVNIRAPKTLVYNNNTDGWPSNFAPVFGVGFCHADGSPLTVADQTLVKVSSQCHMYFKDA